MESWLKLLPASRPLFAPPPEKGPFPAFVPTPTPVQPAKN
jgi:hypothetical protein